jgi:hypothetical protein
MLLGFKDSGSVLRLTISRLLFCNTCVIPSHPSDESPVRRDRVVVRSGNARCQDWFTRNWLWFEAAPQRLSFCRFSIPAWHFDLVLGLSVAALGTLSGCFLYSDFLSQDNFGGSKTYIGNGDSVAMRLPPETVFRISRALSALALGTIMKRNEADFVPRLASSIAARFTGPIRFQRLHWCQPNVRLA